MKNTNKKPRVTIIGFGTMGKAIACALGAHEEIEISVIKRNESLASLPNADFIILAVKPKDIKETAATIKGSIGSSTIVVSILAGTHIKTLSEILGTHKIIRTMPNLGLSVGAGVAVWKMNDGLTTREQQATRKLLDCMCENIEMKSEKLIDGATAISGSGPAYFFLLADSMIQGAKALGLDTTTSQKLVNKTLQAAAALSHNASYQELVGRIASKKGTTEAALKVFKRENFTKIVSKAIKAANKRAQELSK